MNIQPDNSKSYMIDSSGLYICTGSGFQCWYKGLHLPRAENIRDLIKIATGENLNWEEIRDVLYNYHHKIMFSPGNQSNNRQDNFHSMMIFL